MLVVNTFLLELILVSLLINILENILEVSVIFLHDGVLRGELERIASLECILHACVSKALN